MQEVSRTTIAFAGHQVPLTTVIRTSSLESLGYVAKSGVQLGVGGEPTSAQPLIVGFSSGPDPTRAAAISRWEVVERAFATWPLVCELCDEYGTVPGFRWPDPEAKIRVDAREVSLGGPEPTDGWNSSGLAAGSSIEDAAFHAMCERVERHIVGRIWYGDDELVRLGEPRHLFGGGVLSRYVWALDPSIGFVMSVIVDRPPGALICGTAIRPSLKAAIAKADEEALMLLDSHLEGDDGYCDSDAMRTQIASLVAPGMGRARLEHLRERVRRRPADVRPPEVSRASTNRGVKALAETYSAQIAILRAGTEGAVVRASCEGMMSLEQVAARDRGRTVLHPIC